MRSLSRRCWHACKRACAQSLTIAWAYALIAAGVVLDVLPLACDLANTPEIQAAIVAYTGPHASHVMKAIGVITALVRIRSLKGSTP